MSHSTPALDRDDFADRALALAGELLAAQIADPTLLDEIPEGATVVLIPHDDPALTEYQWDLAREAVARGKNVYLKAVHTAPAPERPLQRPTGD